MPHPRHNHRQSVAGMGFLRLSARSKAGTRLHPAEHRRLRLRGRQGLQLPGTQRRRVGRIKVGRIRRTRALHPQGTVGRHQLCAESVARLAGFGRPDGQAGSCKRRPPAQRGRPAMGGTVHGRHIRGSQRDTRRGERQSGNRADVAERAQSGGHKLPHACDERRHLEGHWQHGPHARKRQPDCAPAPEALVQHQHGNPV